MDSELKEFHDALVTIKGNAFRYGNNIYSIHNIVSMHFSSSRKEITTRTPPENFCCLIVKYLIGMYFTLLVAVFVCAHVYLASSFDIEGIINFPANKDEYGISNTLFIIYNLAMFFYIRNSRKYKCETEYNTIYGLKIIFVNNLSLFFVSNSGFIKQTIDQLYSFIARPERASKNELIINFSDSSINIKEAVGSNIIGGSVQGDVTNG